MKLTYLDVLLILAFLTDHIQASRIARIKTTGNHSTESSSIPTDSDEVALKEGYADTTNSTNTAMQDKVNQATSSAQSQTFTIHDDKISTDDNNSLRSFLSDKAPEATINDHAFFNDFNAINLFAQRMSHTVLHVSKDTDKTTTGELSALQTLIWSPLSVYQSLVPLLYAAGGETKVELQKLLLTRAKRLKQLNTTNDDASVTSLLSSHPDETFSSVTGLFARDDVPLNPEYLQELQKNVRNVEVKTIDFHNSANAVKNINSWAVESTQGLIKEAVDETQVGPNMFMMIVNCVRFKASWQTRFDSDLTTISDFHGVSGIQKVQMMKQIGTQRFGKFPIIYSSHDEEIENGMKVPFSVLEMPYANSDLISLFILPDGTAKIQETLEYVANLGVNEIRRMLNNWDVEVVMPKFKIKSDVNVEEALFENGLKTLFTPEKANLTKLIAHKEDGLNERTKFIPEPYLSNIIHRTIFETSEEGTSAAAVTALSIVPLSALSQDRFYLFKLDRPFIVLLVKNDNTIVFQGIIADLNEQEIYETKSVIQKPINEKESSSSATKNDVVVYPTENESKHNIDELISSASENHNSFIEPTESVQGTQQEKQVEANQTTTEDRSWWIPNRVPEYLNSNKSTSLNSTSLNSPSSSALSSNNNSLNEPSSNITSLNANNSSTPKDGNATKPEPEIPSAPSIPKLPVESFQFSKYQQPEPKDPNGIRFPATMPLPRNKVIIKPRYENNAHLKNSLVKWMSIY